MPIITITSDWNKNDYYLPALKGRLFSLYIACKERGILPDGDYFNIVDISNQIAHFNIFEASFILKNSYHHFPDGSIHIMAVESELREGVEMVVVKREGHYFIAPDDGRFALLFAADEGEVAYLLSGREEEKNGEPLNTFAALDYFVEGVGSIFENRLDSLERVELREAVRECAVVTGNMVVGRVVYIDSYGNAITNITRENFFKVVTSAMVGGAKDISYEIFVQGPYLKLHKIDESYSDVEQGEEVALFNSLELLELAINGGNFAAVEGVDTTAEVVIKFKFN